jgi:hypothetical protein
VLARPPAGSPKATTLLQIGARDRCSYRGRPHPTTTRGRPRRRLRREPTGADQHLRSRLTDDTRESTATSSTPIYAAIRLPSFGAAIDVVNGEGLGAGMSGLFHVEVHADAGSATEGRTNNDASKILNRNHALTSWILVAADEAGVGRG